MSPFPHKKCMYEQTTYAFLGYKIKIKIKRASTSLRTWPTDVHTSIEDFCLLSRSIPSVPNVISLATLRSFPNSLKLIPVASFTRLCMVSLLQGRSRQISVPCRKAFHQLLTHFICLSDIAQNLRPQGSESI